MSHSTWDLPDPRLQPHYWWACFSFAWKVVGTMYKIDRESAYGVHC